MADTTHYASDENAEGKYIPKSYQFERDMDAEEPDKRHDHITFDDKDYELFVYSDMDSLMANKPVLAKMVRDFFDYQKKRIDVLRDYSRGRNTAIRSGRRRIEKDKADYRLSHNWGGYISGFATSHVMSIPVNATTESENETKVIEEIKTNNDVNNLNYELAYDAGVYGNGFEYHYRDDADKIVIIPRSEMFLIYDTTVIKNIIGAVHVPVLNGKLFITVYTDNAVYTYDPTEIQDPAFENEQVKKHGYGMVPIVEWQNNRFRSGDFEDVIPLIDAYDSAQSDIANYMSDLNDSLLVINGNLEELGLTPHDVALMKQANTILLQTGMDAQGKQTSASAEYIYKQYDVAGTEAYKDRLINDIHKMANIPNIDDEQFGNQSGIAMQYKLLGLTQLRTTKESFFTKALRRRYKLIENIHRELSLDTFDSSKITFTFQPNLPKDVWEEISQYINAGGKISQETLRENASFTSQTEEEMRLEEEDKTRMNPYLTDEEKGE